MNKVYEEINKRSENKYARVRFAGVEFGARAVVRIVCDSADKDFLESNAKELKALLNDICGFHIPVDIKLDDTPVTPASLRAAVMSFTEGFGYVSSVHRSIVAETEPRPTVRIRMHKAMYGLAENDYIPRLKEFLANSCTEQVMLDISVVDFEESGTAAANELNGRGSVREYELKNVTSVNGGGAPTRARSVASVCENEYNITVCGILAMPTSYLSKGGRKYERFVIYDGERSLQCRAFFELDRSLIGRTVAVFGNAEYDGLRNEASITVRELYTCDADVCAVECRPLPADYYTVRPQPYVEYVQSTVFDEAFVLPQSLKGDFVVFDFETTGLSLLNDTPTELGAVKISNGKPVETFTSLIDPRRPIPDEVVKKTGISNEMVKGKPLFEDILPDFYRFTYGCGLVCHNIPFDFPILLKAGNGCGYGFGDRLTFDTMGLAPAAIPGIQKLTLDRVVEELGLVNDTAHRALSDAIATAKAFIAMNKKIASD